MFVSGKHFLNYAECKLRLPVCLNHPIVLLGVLIVSLFIVRRGLAVPPVSGAPGIVVVFPPFVGELKYNAPACAGFLQPLPALTEQARLSVFLRLQGIGADLGDLQGPACGNRLQHLFDVVIKSKCDDFWRPIRNLGSSASI